MRQKVDVDWQKLVLCPEGFRRLNKLALSRFNKIEDAEEATTYVIEKVSDDNWSKLSSFSGNAKPETYLYSVVVNLFEEYSRQRFGRIRPPEWIKREGAIWLKIWKKICLERQAIPGVIDAFCAKEIRSPDFVLAVIKTIKSRLPWCGVKYRTIHAAHQDEFQEDGEVLSSKADLEDDLGREKLETSLLLISELLENLSSPSIKVSKEVQVAKNVETVLLIKNRLKLEEEDVLILRMAFQEGLKLNVIARSLGMPSYQPGRILKKIFKSLHTELNNIGYDDCDLRALLSEIEL